MKAMKLVSYLATVIALDLLPGLRAADGSQTNLTVEVLIFSGRPNPTWQLQDQDCLRRLKAKLKDQPEAFKAEPAEWSRLGFTGFRIRGGEALGLPGEMRIYQGILKTGKGKESKFLKDASGVEQSLIAEAKKQGLEQAVRNAITTYEAARQATQ